MGSHPKQSKLFGKALIFFAPFGLLLQLLAVFFITQPVSALSNGPFSLDIECVTQHVVLKMEMRQPVAKWITGRVEYQTRYGNTTHSLLPGVVVDTWTLDTGRSEISSGTAKTKVKGLYQWGTYKETFSISYRAVDCTTDTTQPQSEKQDTVNVARSADPLPTTARSDLPADLDGTTILSPPVVAQGASVMTAQPSNGQGSEDKVLGVASGGGKTPLDTTASLGGVVTKPSEVPNLTQYWWLLILATFSAPLSFVTAKRHAL